MQNTRLFPPLSLYIHFPWCIQKCPYCDFNSHALTEELPEDRYITALLNDLAQDLAQFQGTRIIQSIFMGGGTPSLFSAQQLDRLLIALQQQLTFAEDIEITLEANPSTFESDKFVAYRAIGINRLSIGIQSFNDEHLQRLGRIHSAQDAIRAVNIAKQAGFDNFNLDLMFGLPDSCEQDSLRDVQQAIELQPSHISFYQLTLEPNTYFHKYPPALPGDDAIFNEQLACQKLLAEHGYQQYEISAYAQQGKQCRHNINYWSFGDYLGIGAGAHGKISTVLPANIMRTTKPKQPQQYLRQAKDDRLLQPIKESDLPLEFIMNHLRLKKGFSLETYTQRTGLAVQSLQPALGECVEQGLLLEHGQHYQCSEKGWHFLDSILENFLSTDITDA
ncbi:MAG: radical SAM family heme chaperone HemW [Gammaproteobacteria bacterium]|jgi:putative oxygen-independent coproporphyrinogen III oxidase|nr:radical SAM family heme chaperone HemW [Gammaproteobacteria bacterium]MBT5221569.1 radical SAM family heme chaperone HemW [Gammaproteobacteria bacterium]MBT5826798.1 radical SAM family heme chaperone HemW [Gammaproteobacteria bacterium]MBT5967712.1 radical SAM family heme chaperone HemW [Gammaproteobacteria bacterium]MBT6419610.1 radical SAM family heme chaperone HemW [Gammaproteobacteria bacterium]